MSGSSDTIATFRKRMRTYFLRVLVLLVATPLALFVVLRVLRMTSLGADVAGGLVGALALVGVVGGSYLIHWKTVRCPACERWLVPLGVNGFAPNACPQCKAPLR